MLLEAKAKKADSNISSVVSSAIEQYLDSEKTRSHGLTYIDLNYKVFPKFIECFENSGMEFVTLLSSKELSLLAMLERNIPFVFLFSTKKFKQKPEPLESALIEVKFLVIQLNKDGSAIFTVQIGFQTGLLETNISVTKNDQSEIDLTELKKKTDDLIEGYGKAYEALKFLFKNSKPDKDFSKCLATYGLTCKVSQDYNGVVRTISSIGNLINAAEGLANNAGISSSEIGESSGVKD